MFLGIAIGDALGMPVETMTSEQIKERHGFVDHYLRPDGHKWFNGRNAGTWTDDTQLSLVVAESLIAKGDIDMDDLAARHVAALNESDLGWGPSTREAVRRLEAGVHWLQSGKSDKLNRGMGNGLVMKVAPLALLNHIDQIVGVLYLSAMTHPNQNAHNASRLHLASIIYCLNTTPTVFSRLEIINRILAEAGFYEIRERFNLLFEIFLHQGAHVSNQEIIAAFGGGTSLVTNSLPFSYAFFFRNPTLIDALYSVVNAGGDTDTNGSIVGSLLGALNGTSIFPQHLVDGLWQKDRILDTAERFCDRFNVNKT